MSKSDKEDLTSEQGNILEAFSRALGREAHVLTRHPGLMWQQMYNRLQWKGEEVKLMLAPQLDERCLPGARPWARTRTPFQESQALGRTISGHTDWVTSCSISPDSRWIISASIDKTLKGWETSKMERTR